MIASILEKAALSDTEADPDGRGKVGRGPMERRTGRGAHEAIGGKVTDELGPEKDKQGGQEAGTRRGEA